LHLKLGHPIHTLRTLIEKHFVGYESLPSYHPVVTKEQNFDELGFPEDHVGRSLSDSYYINKDIMLRTHTSAHQLQVFRSDIDKFLLTADVYRRDEIDSSHYPVFHQMEGARIFPMTSAASIIDEELSSEALASTHIKTTDDTVISNQNPLQTCHSEDTTNAVVKHLKYSLNGMVKKLFVGQELEVRWIDSQFPFTSPSWEMEILHHGQWLEICGCGVIKQDILNNTGMYDYDLFYY
jgi:phenylalanyl-tRNA synthetase alpha chain